MMRGMKNELTEEQQSEVDLDASADVVTLAVRSLLGWVASRPDFAVDAQRVGRLYAVKVTPSEPDRGVLVSTSHAMRAIVAALGGRHGFERSTYIVDVPHEAPADRARRQDPPSDANWPEREVLDLLHQACRVLFAKGYDLCVTNYQHKTEVMVTVDRREASHVPDADLSDALSRVFGAIARARGRKLFVELLRRVA